MASVLFRRGDILERGADLTVLPCSAKAHISKTADAHVSRFGLPLPSAKKLGEIEVKRFPGAGSVTRYIAWAASVIDYQSTPEVIRAIGERLGQVANEDIEIQLIESPLLGTGVGGLDALIAAPALAQGFLATCRTDATLIVYGQQATIMQSLRRGFGNPTPERVTSPRNSIPTKATTYQYEFGPFRLLPEPRILLRDTNPVGLRRKTFELLLYFVQNPNRLISLRELAEEIWPANQFVDKNNIYATISSLRKVLDDRLSESRYLVSYQGGYRFRADVARIDEGSRDETGAPPLALTPTLESCAVLPFTPLLRLNRTLSSQHLAFLKRFADTRRMKRDARKLRLTPDPIREAALLPLGPQGAYFLGDAERDVSSQDDPSVLDHNRPPKGQPGLWCDWFPTDDGQYIVWNQDEEFDGDVDWLNYIIVHFIAPWGYMLNGEIRWQEGNVFDAGTILVRNNRVRRLSPISIMTESGVPRRLRVFLCHSSRDKSLAREFYDKLRSDGVDPWLDRESLLPGEDWEHEIRRAVRSTDLVIVCLSRNSVSKIGFIQKEIKYALDVADEQPEGTIFIIPVRFEVCDVPERLRSWQWVNLFEEEGYERLISAFTARADFLNEYRAEA